MNFAEINRAIPGIDADAVSRAHDRWNNVAKPIGSLGALELMVEQIAGITGTPNVDIAKRCALIMCADNGVVAEGVSQSGPEITTLIAGSIARGTSSVCTMARCAHIDTFSIDVGMVEPSDAAGVMNKRVAAGTANMLTGPAMSADQAAAAIQAGIDCAQDAAAQGYRIVAVGEMSIGNTTTASALSCALLGMEVEEATGKGAGLSDAGLAHKIQVIKGALKRNAPKNGSYADDPFATLCALGGFDICGMVGLYLGCALSRTPVIIDGFISTIAAYIASQLCPASKQAMLAAHISSEPAAQSVMDALGLSPVLHAGMRLGEATGAICLIPLLDMALALYNGTTFEQTGMDNYEVSPQ